MIQKWQIKFPPLYSFLAFSTCKINSRKDQKFLTFRVARLRDIKLEEISNLVSMCILRFSQFAIARDFRNVVARRFIKSGFKIYSIFRGNSRVEAIKSTTSGQTFSPAAISIFFARFPRLRQRESSKRILTRRKIGGKNRTGWLAGRKKTGGGGECRKAVWNGMKIVRGRGMFAGTAGQSSNIVARSARLG